LEGVVHTPELAPGFFIPLPFINSVFPQQVKGDTLNIMKGPVELNLWKPVLHFEKNRIGRDFVCGDIHGCFDDLEYNLRKLRFDTGRDRMFSVGDLFDRGPRSRDALEYFGQKWLHPVLGNHEQMFLDGYQEYGTINRYYAHLNGSDWRFQESAAYLAELAHKVSRLPLIIQVEDTLILHACLPDVDSLEEVERYPDIYRDTIIWYRDKPSWSIRIPGINKVYCGHNIVNKIEEHNGMINIDTGAFLRYHGAQGKLTIVKLSAAQHE
jgi:serine/threonine protein phosphatase 1